MWFAMGNLIVLFLAGGPFRAMRDAVFGADNHFIFDVLRFGVVAPSGAILIVSYTNLYWRWFRIAAQIIAPIHAMSFIAMDLLMHPRGYSLSSCMPLIVLAPYFLFGMLQGEAARTSLIVVAAYGIGGYLAGITGPQRYFDLAVVSFAAAVGAAVHYSFQQGVRRNYLATQMLSESVNRDSLTGIHNRRMFDEHMARLWPQAIREHAPLALLLVDLDHFKAFNDHNGHQAGDVCLTKVASLLPAAARRPLDLAARYGGEEFAVLLYDMRRDRVEELCRQLHASLARAAIEHPASAVGPAGHIQHRRRVRATHAGTSYRRLHPARGRGVVRSQGTRPQSHDRHGSRVRNAHDRRVPRRPAQRGVRCCSLAAANTDWGLEAGDWR